jgi:hypothetical protein
MAYVVSAVTAIAPIKLLGGIAGIAVVVAGLSGLLGWLKLRRRDLGMLFEANGWAINARMMITRRLGIIFTRAPDFPPGTVRERHDILAGLAEVKAQDKLIARRKRRIWLAVMLALLAGAVWAWFRYFQT